MTTIVGFFKNISEVTKFVQILKRQGFDSSQINVMANPNPVASGMEIEPKRANNETSAAVLVGAVSGATIGLFLGIIWGMKAIGFPGPGTMLTAHPLSTLLAPMATGMGWGAVAGSLVLLGLTMLARPVKEALFSLKGSQCEGVTVAVEVPEDRVCEVKQVLDEAYTPETLVQN